MTRRIGLCLIVSVLPVRAVGQTATPIPRDALGLIVQIVNPVSSPDVDFFGGAGIAIGESDQEIVIATAEHVVRPGAKSLRVVFEFARNDSLPFRIVRVDTVLDLAVIVVARNAIRDYRSGVLAFDRRGDVGRLRVGDPVRPIGCPAGECWNVPATPDPVISVHERGILFESFFTSPGSSGGGLFNEHWELVGMVTQKGDPIARALSIDQVLDSAAAWGYRSSMRLRQRPIPRAGYDTRVGVAFLGPLGMASDPLDDSHRLPSSRMTLVRQTRTAVIWYASFLRLAPDNLSVRAGMVGGGLTLARGRLAVQPFVEAGLGRVEGRYDGGGYFVASGSGNRYVPVWNQQKDDGIGIGGGIEVELTVAPRMMLHALGGHWSFAVPDSVPKLPDLFVGVGARWGW